MSGRVVAMTTDRLDAQELERLIGMICRATRREERAALSVRLSQHIEAVEADVRNLTEAGEAALAAIDKAETVIDRLQQVLRRVLEWPLPEGTVETYSLPPWLAQEARQALDPLAAVPDNKEPA